MAAAVAAVGQRCAHSFATGRGAPMLVLLLWPWQVVRRIHGPIRCGARAGSQEGGIAAPETQVAVLAVGDLQPRVHHVAEYHKPHTEVGGALHPDGSVVPQYRPQAMQCTRLFGDQDDDANQGAHVRQHRGGVDTEGRPLGTCKPHELAQQRWDDKEGYCQPNYLLRAKVLRQHN